MIAHPERARARSSRVLRSRVLWAPPLAVLSLAALAGGPMLAQQPPAGGAFTFRSRAELVNVTATVTDRNERFVPGLRKEDFSLAEDGVPQPITHFSDDRVPVSLGLVVDTSGSMEGEKWTAARDAIVRFLALLGPEDEIFLYAFSDSPDRSSSPGRANARGLTRALTRVRRGGTALYDAVAEAVQIAQGGSHTKKAIIVISDGNDRNSTVDVRAVRQLIRGTEVLVYAIGIDGESEAPAWTRGGGPRVPRVPFPLPGTGRGYPPQWPRQPVPPQYPRGGGRTVGGADDGVNAEALRDLTDDSGGHTEIVREARDLGPSTAAIADELSRQYSLAYTPVAPKDGRWHTIRVDVRGRDYPRAGQTRLPRDALTQAAPTRLVSCRVQTLGLAIALSAIGSTAGLFVASSLLLFRPAARVRLVSWLVSYAVGTLLGASLLHLVPEALEHIATAPRGGGPPRRHPHLLRPGEARHLAALP